jgi:hypothetical protein
MTPGKDFAKKYMNDLPKRNPLVSYIVADFWKRLLYNNYIL